VTILNNVMIPAFIVLIILIFIICFYFMTRYKQQAVQVFTLESFLHSTKLGEDEGKDNSLIEKVNDYFDDGDSDGDGDGGDDGA
jgi:uncharacterized membrane protein YvbJ